MNLEIKELEDGSISFIITENEIKDVTVIIALEKREEIVWFEKKLKDCTIKVEKNFPQLNPDDSVKFYGDNEGCYCFNENCNCTQ